MTGTSPRVDTSRAGRSNDDLSTLAALGILAYIVCDVGHEFGGHGVMCLATGGRPSSFSTTHFQCIGGWQSAITAAGILFNITVGTILGLILRKDRGLAPHARHFVWLTMAYNLFSGWGYLVQSSVTGSGDWAGFLRLAGLIGWRWLMIPAGAAGYYWSLRTATRELGSFAGRDGAARIPRLAYVPYLVAAWIPVAVRALNGPRAFGQLAGALAGSLLFAWGFLALPLVARLMDDRVPRGEAAARLTRQPLWLAAAVTIGGFFVEALGPGIQLAAP